MTSLYDLYRQHKDAAGAFTGGLPAQNTGGYLNMPETPIPAQQSALASLAPGQMGTPSPGAGYAQVGNRRVTLADIGGQNDPFRGGGSVSVADFGGQKTYSLNPDVQRVGMEMEQQRQADQSMRAGLPNGMTLQEFLQAPFSRGKDQGALMQLYQQMQGAAVQQGYLQNSLNKLANAGQSSDVTITPRMALEKMRQDRMDARQANSLSALADRLRIQNSAREQQTEDKRAGLITRQMMAYKKRMDDLWGKSQSNPDMVGQYNANRRGLQDLINEAERSGVDWDNASVGLKLQSNKPTPRATTTPSISLDMNNPKVQSAIKAGYTPEEISAYLARRR
jgi:hypothetical protein